jgi:NADH-ubiquinone oxidoreductase chain 5
LKILTLFVCLLGGLIGFLLSEVKNYFVKNNSLTYYFFSYFSSSIWFLPFISTVGISLIPLSQGFQAFKNLDQG